LDVPAQRNVLKLGPLVRSNRHANKLLWFVRFGFKNYPRLEQDERVISELAQADTVLDLGCARGDLLSALRAKGWDGYYEGVDFSAKAINEARRMGDGNSRFWVSDLERLALPTNSRWGVISLIECVYYVDPRRLPKLFGMLLDHVADQGKLVIRMYDTVELAAHTGMLNALFPNCDCISVNEQSGKMFVVREAALHEARKRKAAWST
jgi:SAM-dependent methyltransferase